jgi:hypothetical protein
MTALLNKSSGRFLLCCQFLQARHDFRALVGG